MTLRKLIIKPSDETLDKSGCNKYHLGNFVIDRWKVGGTGVSPKLAKNYNPSWKPLHAFDAFVNYNVLM